MTATSAHEAEARRTQSQVYRDAKSVVNGDGRQPYDRSATSSPDPITRDDNRPSHSHSSSTRAQVKPKYYTAAATNGTVHRNDANSDTPTAYASAVKLKRHRASTTTSQSTPDPNELPSNKKRKRTSSPPWQFPTAVASTLKTADGRRASARVNLGTPGLSESDDRGRSISQPTSKSRPTSPPWKKFDAEGPTSIRVDGVRKSGRVNKDLAKGPKRVSPRSKKQTDKAALARHMAVEQTPVRAMATKRTRLSSMDMGPDTPHDGRPPSSSSSAKIAALQAQIAALQPTRSFDPSTEERPKRKYTRRQSSGVQSSTSKLASAPQDRRRSTRGRNPSTSPEPPRSIPKLKLRLGSTRNARQFSSRFPALVRPPQLSIYQVLDNLDLREVQQPFMDSERGPPDAEWFEQRAEKQAAEEAAIRARLLRESEPGGVLSRDKCSLFRNDRQQDLPAQYGHSDHLVSHALYLRQLQLREKLHHRTIAKKIAYEALEYWRAMHGPTEEDLIAEQNKVFELIRKQVVVDMKAKWEMVEAHVKDVKRLRWEAEEKVKKQELLRKKLDTAQTMLAKQRGEIGSDEELEEDSTGDVLEDEDDEERASDSDAEAVVDENMSESSSESEEEGGIDEAEMDEAALAAYLAHREAEPPDKTEEDSDSVAGQESEAELDVAEAHHISPKRNKKQDASDQQVDATLELTSPDVDSPMAEANDTGVEVSESVMGSETQHRKRLRGQTSRSLSPTGEEAEAEKHLSSDESTDMDSEDYDSDDDMSSTGDELDDENENDASNDDKDSKQPSMMKNSLLALFTPKELLAERDGSLPTPMTSVENGGEARSGSEVPSEEQADGELADDELMADQEAEGTDTELDRPQEPTPCDEDADGLMSQNQHEEAENNFKPTAQDATGNEDRKALVPAVPIPSLLRGTLRSYQHAGLNWLASLYRNGTNGILADEMGLGKTIQTISVLAHVSEEYGIWEPHLVIVPTSVILNWATEFQKFLPGYRVLAYYGTQEERQLKRKGWANDPHHDNKERRGYNVVVTSYNIAMQDISSLRNVQWHYLILDEAHNIRNYNSQRWKVLIRLRSKARILLTGTPLQNNLDEVWALLTFLRTGDEDESSGHGELEEFLSHWEPIVKQIFQDGADKLSAEAQTLVKHLHVSLRPFLLRRQKNEVEKDLPKKTERVVVCKLSKRQRQLYQDYMGLAETKATLAKGSGIQAGAVLLSLRRVCNHPDLFDPRPIQTSFAMEWSPLEKYSVRENLVRSLLGAREDVPNQYMISSHESLRKASTNQSRRLKATAIMTRQAKEIEDAIAGQDPDPATLDGSRAYLRLQKRRTELQHLRDCIQLTETAVRDRPIYGADLRELLTIRSDNPYAYAPRRQPLLKTIHAWPVVGRRPFKLDHHGDWWIVQSTRLHSDIATLDRYAERFQDIITRFAFVPPAATAPILQFAIPPKVQTSLRSLPGYPSTADYGHEARVRLSIAFPDSRLLIYDSGKLQRLTYLLRDLQARGSRSLIFTQMVGTLDILEQFLSLLGMPYLRLDGSTSVERRQLYSAEFNRPDSKYQCMILSSRAGGVGLNLTGASSVIFYDLDWNPQMDRQCMDRAHRIGQVRDVEVYKMVSEKTVEENILRRANQKSLLDQTVIQEGRFTTEQEDPDVGADQGNGDVDAAIERLLGGNEKSATQALESVEDKEDVQAAQAARKEDQTAAEIDAAEDVEVPAFEVTKIDAIKEERRGHVDAYMIGFVEQALKHWVYMPPLGRRLDKHGRDPSHRPKKKR